MLRIMSRPVATFDPTNKQHRSLLAKFVQTRSWAHSPIHFVASEATEVDVGTMQRQMIEYYIAKEFGETESKNELTARQKGVIMMTL